MSIKQVVIKGTISGQAMDICRYWNAVLPAPDYQDFADNLGAAFAGAIDSLVCANVTFNSIYIRDVAVGSIGITVIPDNFPFSGGISAATVMPSHDAVKLDFTAPALTYPYKGYNRISGLDEAQVQGGVLLETARQEWENVSSVLATAYGLVNRWEPVLWSDTYQAFQPISSHRVSATISTQRSRRQGVGA